jgi:uncharacterized membrane protein YdjX (TVP38/TMEM64 family)
MKKKILLKGFLFFTLICALFLSQFFLDVAASINPESIVQWLREAGSIAPVVYMCVMALAVVISPIPSLPLDIAAGASFGPFMGTVYSLAGALAGAVISFLIARLLGRGLIENFLGGHINFCVSCSDKLLTKIVFFSRLIPVVSFDIVSYGAGLTKMSLKKFTAATFFGMIPLTFMYNYFGTIFIISRGITLILGLLIVIFLFLIPKWIEERDLFNMRRLFQHHRG